MISAASPDAIVVGAGIVGAACAAALTRDGLRVLVLEAGFAGGGTTAAGMGHLVAMDDSPEQLALTAYSLRLWTELAPRLGRAVEMERRGTLWIAEDEHQLGLLLTRQQRYSEYGVESELLDAGGLRSAEPNLRPALAGALLVPGDGVLYPPAAALALLDEARSLGAIVRERCSVESISANAVRSGREQWTAGIVINAAGPWAPSLTPALPILPRRGHLVITDREPGFCRHQLVEVGYLASASEMAAESIAFNVQPRATGQLLIGSSRELAGWDSGVNRRVVQRMVARALNFMPALGGCSAIRSWTGFRPATPDKLPLIGPWEETPGLWIAAGHEGLGITTSLATGRLLADLVAGRQPAIDASPFAPARVSAMAPVRAAAGY